ncbi:flagellar FliL protein [Succinivibrio dextrinosolvens DSM 3072]|uniref:Flagellar protein FliL n=2 Tax=Succinivibrio dextrinosolvens TaxID=83771 RepID=A0A1T4V3H2_9GAMM|nr:flagellar FliL protein [Succinivibrio dextrinosolvens DSM 3072]
MMFCIKATLAYIKGKKMLKKLLLGLVSIIFIAVSSSAYASGHGKKEEPAEPENVAPEIGYYQISPDITTNVATLNPRDKIHYVRIKISLMLEDSRDSTIIADVEPLIKDAIVTILGSKEFGQVATNEAREKIRVECREKVTGILQEKFGKPLIIDLLFLSYMYQ